MIHSKDTTLHEYMDHIRCNNMDKLIHVNVIQLYFVSPQEQLLSVRIPKEDAYYCMRNMCLLRIQK